MSKKTSYRASDFGKKEVALMNKFFLQRDDARRYFLSCVKPRLDRYYKLYISYNGDRAKEIKSWQANIFVPYINATIETLIPRIVDARPEFNLMGRNEDDQMKSGKLQSLMDYTWEIANMDEVNEMVTRSALIYGTSYMQVSWKKDVRTHKFLDTKDLTKKRLKWTDKTKTFYDAPYAEWVDNYDLWYDWHNIKRELKQFWFKRLVLPGSEIKRRYPGANPARLEMAFTGGSGDLEDYASIRNEVKFTQEKIVKGADRNNGFGGLSNDIYQSADDPDLKMHEVFEWTRPFDDAYSVMVNDVPVFDKGSMPILYDFKECPFIEVPYLKLPNEFEGYGLPAVLENPQLMLNLIKNQRLDSVTLNIHKMWIVNPLANVDRSELVTRPFGIIYSHDPQGVREVQFSDVKPSAYKEEEMLKSDMRYASGVDDFSMGVGGGASSATEVRHLRESTLERVRLFINHLGDGYATLMRYWISLYGQFLTKETMIRIVGDDGKESFPIIEKDDLVGNFDYKATVTPSIAGKNEIEKKQGMDLFQLLSTMPFVDIKKLTSKILHHWNWDIESVSKKEEVPQEMADTGNQQIQEETQGMPDIGSGEVPQDVIDGAVSMLGGRLPEQAEGFDQAAAPINLLESGSVPPTAPGIAAVKGNPRGLNRGGNVNTNVAMDQRSTPEGNLLNQANNIQN